MEAGTMYDVSSYSGEAWARLGRAIRTRRVAKGMSQKELADVAKVGPNTVTNIESGRPGRELTLAAITSALGWTPESYFLVLEGGQPVIIDEADVPDDDALHIPRPEGIPEDEWAQITEKMHADMAFWLRTRRGE